MIILLEGADGSGKSTLAADLKKRFGARVMHGRVWKNMAKWQAGMFRRACRIHSAGGLVVLDRHWISEAVYGPVFRGRMAYGDDVAEFYDWTIRNNGAVVLCVPGDVGRHLRDFDALRATRPEKFDDIQRIVWRYRLLAEGFMIASTDDYLGKYVAYGDFLWQKNAFKYDRYEYECGPARFNDSLMRRLGWWRTT